MYRYLWPRVYTTLQMLLRLRLVVNLFFLLKPESQSGNHRSAHTKVNNQQKLTCFEVDRLITKVMLLSRVTY